ASAAAEGGPDATETARALSALRAGAGAPLRVERHPGSSRIRTIEGRLSAPAEGSPEAIAAGFLAEQAALFGLDPQAGDLVADEVRQSPGGFHVTFRQFAGGLPVFNGGVEVTLDRDRRVFLVNSEYVPAGGIALAPALAADEAVASAVRAEAAAREAGTSAPPSVSGEPRLGVYLDGETPRLAWRFVTESRSPFAVVEQTVDAGDGRVLLRRDLVQRAVTYKDGWGRVFNPNPVRPLNRTTLRDNADADGPAFTPAYVRKPLPKLVYNATTGQVFLRGRYVNVTDAREPPYLFPATKGVVSTTSKYATFLFGRTPDQFEHVMVYYHIDANQRYIQGLGFNAYQRQILVDPHGAASHYVASSTAPGTGYLAFSSAGVDDAEDADIILHEYAHAIQDNQSTGKYLGTTTEAAAMGEGFADYWAASSTYDQSIVNGVDPACVGEWNGAGSVSGCTDRVDSKKTYKDKVGAAQADGQIWSALLWEIFKSTGDRGATDKIVLESHYLVPPNPTFADGATALLAADTLDFGGAHHPQICSAATARGIVVEGCEFSATVTWDNPQVDLDLRLRPPDGAGTVGWDYANDCYSNNPNPDWGVAGDASDNPLLKADCRYPACTEQREQIVAGKFTTPGTYAVLVHFYDYYWQAAVTTTTATISVYRGGALLCSGTQLLSNPDNLPDSGSLWEACTVEVAPAP
ncbi:MAG TPA: M4 family metallopeptidase, partial [bacterium]